VKVAVGRGVLVELGVTVEVGGEGVLVASITGLVITNQAADIINGKSMNVRKIKGFLFMTKV
jgi:hypothetical protein